MLDWRCLFLLLLFIPGLAESMPTGGNQAFGEIESAMREPHSFAIRRVRNLGDQATPVLKDLAFNDKWPMNTRWKAFMLLTQAQGKASLPLIKKALTSPTWYMRSAGLTSLQELDAQLVQKWAYRLLSMDPALMVRMKALEILKASPSEKVTELFWEKLYSRDSVYREQSLWIRGDIARILLQSPRTRDMKRWVRLLHDSDQELQGLASVALARLHGEQQAQRASVSFWKNKFPSKNL